MNYCPHCGTKLIERPIAECTQMACPNCTFIDWDTWMNVAVVVVAYNDNDEFLMVQMKSQQTGTLTFPQGFRELGETLPEAAQREFLEETGSYVENLKIHDIYTDDAKRLVWVSYTGTLGQGEFAENEETSAVCFFSADAPPSFDNLRGHLTERLLRAILRE